jgi:GAF domain-containing protein
MRQTSPLSTVADDPTARSLWAESLSQISALMLNSHDLDKILQAIADAARQLLAVRWVAVSLLEKEIVRIRTVSGVDDAETRHLYLRRDTGVPDQELLQVAIQGPGGGKVGYLSAEMPRNGLTTTAEARLVLTMMAGQAALAIENDKLLTSEQRWRAAAEGGRRSN